MVAAGLEKVKSAVDVGREVKLRRLDGRSDACTGGEVDDSIERALRECPFHEDGITDVALDEGDF